MKKLLIAALGAAVLGLAFQSVPGLAQQKTVKECQTEWRANKAAYQAAKITEKAYVEKCRAGQSVALPSAPSTPTPPQPTPTTSTPAPKPPAPATTTARPAPAAPTGAGQFATEAEAKAHCPSDLVVWANLQSKIYHFAGHKNYGTTKSGAYMCERDATAGGFRASKVEKRPGA